MTRNSTQPKPKHSTARSYHLELPIPILLNVTWQHIHHSVMLIHTTHMMYGYSTADFLCYLSLRLVLSALTLFHSKLLHVKTDLIANPKYQINRILLKLATNSLFLPITQPSPLYEILPIYLPIFHAAQNCLAEFSFCL